MKVKPIVSKQRLAVSYLNNKRLFVGNLPFTITEDALRDLFAKAGTVVSVKIITDKFSGRSKGFAFVEMTTDEEAQKAIEMYNEQEVEGRKIIVNIARPMEDRPRRDFDDRRGGDNRRGDR